jgi:hypothetical protein
VPPAGLQGREELRGSVSMWLWTFLILNCLVSPSLQLLTTRKMMSDLWAETEVTATVQDEQDATANIHTSPLSES